MKLTLFSVAITFCYVVGTLADKGFSELNADDAEALQKKFTTFTPDQSCKTNENACVKDQFAQCSNGKFALQPCAPGLKCVVLPLVLKRGTSIACATEEEQKRRLDEARSKKNTQSQSPTSTSTTTSSSSPSQPSNTDSNTIRKLNADDAEALQKKFTTFTPNQSCKPNEIACVKDQFAQCSNGKFALQPCASGLKCVVLPLVLKRGTSIACDTEKNRVNRIKEAREGQ